MSGPSGVATYTYDASGQRMTSVVTTAGKTTTTAYDYDGIQLLGLSATRSDRPSWKVRYLYDSSDRPFAGVYVSDTCSATAFAIETSDRGDVRELVDASGAAFALYSYDAYGNPAGTMTTATASVTSTRAAEIAGRQILRYAGYAWDAETSLYYCSARYYDPAVAQFISKDPEKADGEESAYQYCGGDPVGGSDPSGRKVVKNFKPRKQSWDNCFAVAMLIAGRQALGKWQHTEKNETSFWYAGDPDCGGCPDLTAQDPPYDDGVARCDFSHWDLQRLRDDIRSFDCMKVDGSTKAPRSFYQVRKVIDGNHTIICGGTLSGGSHAWNLGGYRTKNEKGKKVREVFVRSATYKAWLDYKKLVTTGAGCGGFVWKNSIFGLRKP